MDSHEIELIARARDGDQAAFGGLVQRHDARVMSLVRSILGEGFDAEEVYQEIFLKVHRALGSFRFESDFSTWIHRIAVNAALTRRRSVQRRRQKEQVMEGDDFFETMPSSPWDNPETQHLRREILQKIEAALEEIPARQRAVFVMKHDQGMKLKEIAGTLGIREGTAKAYLFRAVENLRRVLRPYYEGGE